MLLYAMVLLLTWEKKVNSTEQSLQKPVHGAAQLYFRRQS